jgi:hypothetical protein
MVPRTELGELAGNSLHQVLLCGRRGRDPAHLHHDLQQVIALPQFGRVLYP